MEGTPFGRYRLVELLGRGGMGEVWKAYDTAMNRVVALKVLPANLADDEQYQARFRREAQMAAGLDEPHVVPIHDFGEIDGRLYVTMRLIDGQTVNELLVNGPLAPHAQSRSSNRSPPPSTPPTASGWFTATSNRRTSW